jgi:RNA-directed DNA polymerase
MRPLEGKMPGTPSLDPISTRRRRIAELASQSPQAAFTTLAHHIDIDWLHEAYRRTRKDGAVGVDGQTAADYAADLEGNLRSLLDRAKSGRYQAPPVRRVHIPKGTGSETRPIGIPTFEDKVLQRAVSMVLEAVYEQDFLDCSYGFRPGRSAHQALDALWHRLMEVGGGWVVEIDIRKFFDALDHRHLHAILCRRVRDGVLLRLIGKWLNAGALEDGCVTHPESGSPQGGVVSPVLANAYLHGSWTRGSSRRSSLA